MSFTQKYDECPLRQTKPTRRILSTIFLRLSAEKETAEHKADPTPCVRDKLGSAWCLSKVSTA